MQFKHHPNPSDDARHVLTHPETYHDQPALIVDAWATLKAERGQTVDLDRIGTPVHLIEAPVTNPVQADFDLRAARIRDLIRKKVSSLGQPCAPHDGDAA
ncbi:MAG: hypothetical protein ACPG61_10255 [Paracoccaceae bacterium]